MQNQISCSHPTFLPSFDRKPLAAVWTDNGKVKAQYKQSVLLVLSAKVPKAG